MDNAYLRDALYCVCRASRAMSENMEHDALYDAAIYYAFGIEKICKAVLYDVNPVFLYENAKLENVAPVLYANLLQPAARKKLGEDKTPNRSVIPFGLSVLLAGHFSKAIHERIGEFTHLADIRGCLAHRTVAELNVPETCRFLVKTFHPSLQALSADLGFDLDDCFVDDKEKILAAASEGILKTEGFIARMKALVKEALERWKKRQKTESAVKDAQRYLWAQLEERLFGMPYRSAAPCPACDQTALVYYRFLDKEAEEYREIISTYAVGLFCPFCLLKLSGYAMVDYFKLNDLLVLGRRIGPEGHEGVSA